MKSATTYLLMAVHERYWMSNLLNSMAQSANRLAASGLLIARHRGLLVRMIIV